MRSLARAAPTAAAIRVQLMSQSAGLRTALRRRLNAAEQDYQLLADGTGQHSPATTLGEQPADIIILDYGLPGFEGSRLVRQIAARHPDATILVVIPDDRLTDADRRKAIGAGARAVFAKPDAYAPLEFRPLAEAIVEALGSQPIGRARRTLSDAPLQGARKTNDVSRSARALGATPRERRTAIRTRPDVLVVGSSTGGPQALLTVFSALNPETISIPVLIVQHMPAAFTSILAEHLSRATSWIAREATNTEPLVSGEIRVAPGGVHMAISGTRRDAKLRLTQDAPVNFCRPAADVLFASAAQIFGSSVLAVILTGMGNDGCEGAKAIVAAGGEVLAQDEATSVVWGMPGAAVGAGVVKEVLPLKGIPGAVQRAMGPKR